MGLPLRAALATANFASQICCYGTQIALCISFLCLYKLLSVGFTNYRNMDIIVVVLVCLLDVGLLARWSNG